MMRNALFLGIILAFLVGIAPSFALTINAQADTVCGLMDCSTCVDLSKYISDAQITALKGINLTSRLPGVMGNITKMSYNISNKTICITGKIKPGRGQYWTMDLNGAAVIDPWWSSSFTKKKPINVSIGTNRVAQLFLNVTYDADMQADFDDIRFVNGTDNGELSYYKYNYVASTRAEFYVNGTWNTTNMTQLFMYYGNATVSTTSNGKTTFPLFDDFDDGSINSTIWNTTTSTESGGLLKLNGSASWNETTSFSAWGVGYAAIFNMSVLDCDDSNTAFGWHAANGGAPLTSFQENYNRSSVMNFRVYQSAEGGNDYGSCPSGFNTYEVRRNSSTVNVTFRINFGTQFNYSGAQVSVANTALRFSLLGAGKWVAIDKAIIRDYTFTDPVAYFGAEEGLATTTDTDLWINGAQANITTGCSWENTNYTATINVTGLPVSIMYNDTIVNTSTTNTQWYGSLIAGLWNFTANYSGNATYAASSTWLLHNITLGDPSSNVSLTFNTTPATNNTTCLNVPLLINCSSYALEDSVALYNNTSNVGLMYNFTPTAAGVIEFKCGWNTSDCYAAGNVTRYLTVADCTEREPNATLNISEGCCPISTFYCTDNETLVQMWNTSDGVSYAYQDCTYGCDNQTNVCAPPPYQQNLILFAVICVIMFLGYKLVRWLT